MMNFQMLGAARGAGMVLSLMGSLGVVGCCWEGFLSTVLLKSISS